MIFKICLVLLTLALSYSKPLETVVKNGKVWRYIGFADGKIFMGELNQTMKWEQAGHYCRLNQMELASITSKTQADVLYSSFEQFETMYRFWTSGRDAMSLKQFVWNDTKTQPSEEYLQDCPGCYELTNCLVINAQKGHAPQVVTWPCTMNFYPLCQDVVQPAA